MQVHIVPERSAVILSMIFKWYGTDFGADSVAVLRCAQGFAGY